MLASDVSAIISRTQNVVYLKDGELLHMTSKGFTITTLDAEDVSPVIDKVTWRVEDADVGTYTHFMEKEIFEQPAALENSMRGRFSEDGSTAQFADVTSPTRYWFTNLLWFGLGPALEIWSLCGLVWLATRRTRIAWVTLAFPLAYFFSAGRTIAPFMRYAVPLAPALALAAAVLSADLLKRPRARR